MKLWLRISMVAGLAALAAACTSAERDFSDIAAPAVTSVSSTATAAVSVSYPRFGDRDPHDWSSRSPNHYAVHGTDVSKYQFAIDWRQARANGISFAYIKATEGGDRVDDYFHANWRAAKAAGIPRGAYHFFYFCRPAFQQARWFIKHVPRDKNALPPVLDMEWNPQSPSCKFRPKPPAVQKEMSVFLKMLERHYGKKPIVYVTPDFYRDNNLHEFKGYPFWLRSTADHPADKYRRNDWLFWQYTGTGVVPGIEGDADINVFNGGQQEWLEWLAGNTG